MNGNSSNQDCKALQRVVRLAERISGSALPSLQDIYFKRSLLTVKSIHIPIIRIAATCTYPVQPVCTSLSSLLFILLFIKSHYTVFAHPICFLFYCIFYSLFIFFASIYIYIYICSCVVLLLLNFYYFALSTEQT